MAPVEVPQIKLGSEGFTVSKQGLGCMGMSGVFGPAKPEEDMIQLIRKAVESGITFLDTSDAYGPHANEVLVGKAIKGIRDKVQLATKFGISIDSTGWKIRGDPAYIRACAEGSLKRLDVDCIDLYYQHRVDPKVPIEITVGEMKKLVEEGKVKYLGLSEASAKDIRRAHAIHPITAVQFEWSLWSRDIEQEIVPTCRELGIGIVPYSPLGRGFFSGITLGELHETDFRKSLPRFQAENYAKNKEFYDRLVAIGAKKNATPGQLALAWLQHQGRDVAPIPGTTKVKNLEENIGALAVELSRDELEELQNAVPHDDVFGARMSEIVISMSFQKISSPPLSSWSAPT